MFGTYLSTFSAYAMRMRGWYYARDGEGRALGGDGPVPGGGVDAYYIVDDYKDAMGNPGYDVPKGQSFLREFRFAYEGVA